MLFSENAMANIGNNEAAKRAKISALVASLLKDHREALHFIPDIFEQFNALQSNEHKSTLIERENKDLKQKVESLSHDIEVKNQRIAALGQKIEAMEFIGQQSFSGERIAALGKQLEATTFTNQQSFTADRIIEKDEMLREKDEK
ncbi:uncharacterized protein [Montipora foliosa]|uniref:uncharacterized protein n=1 Tax=Montipora foliosa TaxID=591990 RepID=UPI0035F1C768